MARGKLWSRGGRAAGSECLPNPHEPAGPAHTSHVFLVKDGTQQCGDSPEVTAHEVQRLWPRLRPALLAWLPLPQQLGRGWPVGQWGGAHLFS